MTSVFPRLHTARSPKNDHEFRHPIPSFLRPSHHRPNPFLFIPNDGTPSRPRLCLPPLPDAPLPFREFTFPPAWGTILDAPSRSLPPLAGTASLPAPAPLSAVRLSPRLPSIQSLLHPTSTIFRGGHVIQQCLSTPPGGDSTAVIGKYGPASSPSRPIVVTTGRRRATANPRQPDEMGTSHKSFYLKATSEGSVDEDVRDGSGVKKRKRRRGGNELPRDAHLRKYACELCGKMFSRPSARTTHHRSHYKDTLYACPEPTCVSRFKIQSNMRRHCRAGNHVYLYTDVASDEAGAPSLGLGGLLNH